MMRRVLGAVMFVSLLAPGAFAQAQQQPFKLGTFEERGHLCPRRSDLLQTKLFLTNGCVPRSLRSETSEGRNLLG